MPWYWNNWEVGWAGAILMMILMVSFWGGIIALIVWGILRLARGGERSRRGPLDIARDRYARGGISREEYEQIKKDLS